MILFVTLFAYCQCVTYNWVIGYVTVSPTSFERRAIGVNGKWPPEPMIVTLGDSLIVNVKNNLNVPTALHAHGLYQNKTNFMDGAFGITECGILPGESFTYNFTIAQTGTYWIHGHFMGQYVDGLRAPLILLDPKEPAKYDSEYIVSLADWYHQEHGPLLDHFLSIYNPTGAEPVPQSPLINESTNQTFVFSPKKTYRLRFIAMSALSRFNVWIDNHNMTVIEVDGINVEPFETSVLNVAAAQRYSVLVTADKPPDFNYMMHVEFDTLMFDNVPDDTVLELTALLEYKRDNPVFASEAKKPDPSAFVDTNLVPLIPERVAPASVSHLLNVYIGLFEDGINYSVFNEIPFELPKTPSLFTALSMGNDSLKPEIYGKRTNVIVLNHMDMIELVIENTDPGHHPFHLHGHSFQVLKKSDKPYEPDASIETLKNPLRRDTVVVPGNGHAIIRFRADNPGVWLFHCHVEWHLQAGLGMILLSAPLEMQKSITVPQSVIDGCKKRSISTSGNLFGLNSLDMSKDQDPPKRYPETFTPKGIWALAGTIMCAFLGLASVIYYVS